MAKKLTKEQKDKRLLKWAKEVRPFFKEKYNSISLLAETEGKKKPPPPPDDGE